MLKQLRAVARLNLVSLQADSPRVAAEVLQKYDESVSEGYPIHRVSELFAGTSTGTLRCELEEFAASGIMSTRLRTEVTAYQLTLLDDTVAESPHATISRVVKGKTHSKPVLWSMELRFKQNAQTMESVDRLEPGIF